MVGVPLRTGIASTVRAQMATAPRRWSTTAEIHEAIRLRVVDAPSSTKVGATLANLEAGGYVEAMRSEGEWLKSWRLTEKGCIAAGVPYAEEGAVQEERPAATLPPPTTTAMPIGTQPETGRPVTHYPSPRPTTSTIDLGPVVERVVDQIVGEFRAHLEARLSKELGEVLAASASAALEKLPTALFQSPQAPPRDRLTVVGLLPGQAALIENEFRKEFRFTFVPSDQVGSKLKGSAANSSATLVMTDFVSHKTDAMLAAVGATVIKVQGGMTHLRDALTELYCEKTTSI